MNTNGRHIMNYLNSIAIPSAPTEIRALAEELVEHADQVERGHYEAAGRWFVEIEWPHLDRGTTPGQQFHLAGYTDNKTQYSTVSVLALDTPHTEALSALPGESWNYRADKRSISTFVYVGRFEFIREYEKGGSRFASFAEVENPHYASDATVPGIVLAAQALGENPTTAMKNALRRVGRKFQTV